MPPMLMPPSVIWITASCSVLWASSYLYVTSHLSESFRWDLWAIFPSVSVMMACWDVRHLYMSVSQSIKSLGFPDRAFLPFCAQFRLLYWDYKNAIPDPQIKQLNTSEHVTWKTSKVSQAHILLGQWQIRKCMSALKTYFLNLPLSFWLNYINVKIGTVLITFIYIYN